MAKNPENMTPEERLTRIRSLERKVSDLERDKMWAEREAESVRSWGLKAWDEIRRLEEVCSRHWDEKNEYRMAAGLEPEYTLIATFDKETREWIPAEAKDG